MQDVDLLQGIVQDLKTLQLEYKFVKRILYNQITQTPIL